MIQNFPSVAVIINCHNGEKFLSECFYSIIRQSFENLEIVFYDNNSKDRSYDIACEFQKRDSRIKIYKCDRTYELDTIRSEAIKKISADLISFIEVDDYWSTQKTELQVKKFLEDPSLGLVFGKTVTKRKGNFFEHSLYSSNQNFHKYISKKKPINFSSIMFTREAYEKTRGFHSELKNVFDCKLLLKITQNFKFDYVDEYICLCRNFDNNLSNGLIYLFRKKIPVSFINKRFFNKNILFFQTNSKGGGAEKVIMDLEEGLSLRKYRVNSISILEDNQIGYKAERFSLSHKNIIFLFKFIKYLKESEDSIILSTIYHTNLISVLANFFSRRHHLIFSLHNGIPYQNLSIVQKVIFKILAIFSYKKYVSVLACSARTSEEHINNGFSKNISIIENGIGILDYKSLKKDNYFYNSIGTNNQQELVIGFFSRYHALKNHDFLLKILMELNKRGIDSKLILAGTDIDPSNKELVRSINNYNISEKVQLLGYRDDINSLLNEIDIYISPSKAEALPLSLIEASLSGKYIISSNVGDCNDIIKFNGKVISGFDESEYADAVIEYINFDNKKKKEISKLGIKNTLKRFSKEAMVEEYDSFLKEIYR